MMYSHCATREHVRQRFAVGDSAGAVDVEIANLLPRTSSLAAR